MSQTLIVCNLFLDCDFLEARIFVWFCDKFVQLSFVFAQVLANSDTGFVSPLLNNGRLGNGRLYFWRMCRNDSVLGVL